MANEIPFEKKKKNASVLAWCDNIKLWPGKFLYYFTMYFPFSLIHSKQYILGSLLRKYKNFKNQHNDRRS